MQEAAREAAPELRRRFAWPAPDVRDWYRALLD
jgi:hypothetical protein